MIKCATIVDNMKKNSFNIFKFVVNHLQIFEYCEVLYLVRHIYVRFICQQQRQNFSVSIVRSYIRCGSTILHTKLS